MKFYNFLFKVYYPTEYHKSCAEIYTVNKGENVIVTGFPGLDFYLDKEYIPRDVWKIQDPSIKKIIWAPHHSIESDTLSLSNFMKYYDFMFKVASIYLGEIQIAFKPHPALKHKLFAHPDWGHEKTNEYYKKWESLSNGQIVESGYVDLFLTSDAMIHDSGSFTVEYLSTGKPVMYLIKEQSVFDRLNDFGKETLSVYYQATQKRDIFNFIENVVLKGSDLKKDERERFKKTYLIPPGLGNASHNIYKELLNSLNLKI